MADFHLYATYAIILAMIVAYVSDRFPVENVALGSLTAFVALFGIVPYVTAEGKKVGVEQMIEGFANPALFTVLALLIVGQGLFATDAMDRPARMIARLGGRSAQRAMTVTLLAAFFLSGFLNDTPVVVIFIPVVIALAAQRGLPASSSLLPLSYLAVLGGMTTLIGSSTNILVGGVARRYGHEIGIFDITPLALMLAAPGVLYVLFIAPRLLGRAAEPASSGGGRAGDQFIGEIAISAGHPLLGLESRAGMFPGMKELTPRIIIRRGLSFLPPFEDITLSEGDRVVVAGTRRAFMNALAGGQATPASETEGQSLTRPDAAYHVIEAVIPPGSRHADRTIRNAGIQSTHNVDLLGIQRKSRMGRAPLADIRLEPGDTILVGVQESRMKTLRESHDLIFMEWSAQPVPQKHRAGVALAIFASVVLVAALELAPIAATSIIGAALMIATGCLTRQQAARAFDRQIFLLIGSSIAAATALEQTGGARLIAESAIAALSGFGPAVILSCLFLLVAVMTNILSNNATALLFSPIAFDMARATGAPIEAFVACIIFASNCSYATPIGYQTHLMIMGPGGYRFSDYVKTGTPLIALVWLMFSLLAPWYYGL